MPTDCYSFVTAALAAKRADIKGEEEEAHKIQGGQASDAAGNGADAGESSSKREGFKIVALPTLILGEEMLPGEGGAFDDIEAAGGAFFDEIEVVFEAGTLQTTGIKAIVCDKVGDDDISASNSHFKVVRSSLLTFKGFSNDNEAVARFAVSWKDVCSCVTLSYSRILVLSHRARASCFYLYVEKLTQQTSTCPHSLVAINPLCGRSLNCETDPWKVVV